MGSLEEFWKIFNNYTEEASNSYLPFLFRGVSDKDYELIPSIGRGTKSGTLENIEHLESRLISDFKRLSLPELKVMPELDIEWLFLAQHYGLPTRLLDWSSNPMVALFFSVFGDDEKDAALYVAKHQITDQYELYDFRTADFPAEDRRKFPIRFADEGTVIFTRPKYTDQRYINQKSVFSCPANPFVPLKIDHCEKIIIEAAHKNQLRKILKTIGVSHSYIYPGLAGIAEEIRVQEFKDVIDGRLVFG